MKPLDVSCAVPNDIRTAFDHRTLNPLNSMTSSTPLAGVGLGAAVLAQAADSTAVQELIAQLQNSDDQVRGPAWQKAGPLGASAVQAIVPLMTNPEFETARAAKRALWQIVHHAGRPNAPKEAKAVIRELLSLLAAAPVPARREMVWMLSEIAGDEAVPPLATLLEDPEMREDARCALQRFPGDKSIAALRKALGGAPDDFKPALADALRARGEAVAEPPSRKLIPTKETSVKAA